MWYVAHGYFAYVNETSFAYPEYLVHEGVAGVGGCRDTQSGCRAICFFQSYSGVYWLNTENEFSLFTGASLLLLLQQVLLLFSSTVKHFIFPCINYVFHEISHSHKILTGFYLKSFIWDNLLTCDSVVTDSEFHTASLVLAKTTHAYQFLWLWCKDRLWPEMAMIITDSHDPIQSCGKSIFSLTSIYFLLVAQYRRWCKAL